MEKEIENLKTISLKTPTWSVAPGCGCKTESGFETYAFYPFWAANDQIDFGAFSRIGFYAMIAGGNGKFTKGLGSNNINFTELAHRYNTHVDFVISCFHFSDQASSNSPDSQKGDSTQENSSDSQEDDTAQKEEIEPANVSTPSRLDLTKDYVIYQLVQNIVALVNEYGGDGVTIDFNGIPEEIVDRFDKLIFLLDERLEKEDPDLYLNLVLPYERLNNDIFLEENLKVLEDHIDLFLIMDSTHPGSDPARRGQTSEKCTLFSQFDRFRDYGLKKKVVPVFNVCDGKFEEYYDYLVGMNFKGAGLWALGLIDGLPDRVKDKFSTVRDDDDIIKDVLRTYFPKLCQIICPNRVAYRIIVFGVTLLFVLFWVISWMNCDVRALKRRYSWYVLGASAFILLLFYLLMLCDPLWQGYRTEATLVGIIVVAGYIIKMNWDKKKEARMP
jgi:hypothetical protein